MKLKLVKKLFITTVAMTMVVGMSVTALAGSSGSTASGNTASGNTVSGNTVSNPIYDVVEEIDAMKEKINAEKAIPVTSFFSTNAINAIPAEVKETVTTNNMFNISKITTTQGFIAAIDKIVNVNPTASSVVLYSSTPIAFNANSVTALSDANKEFVYMFKHDGHLYKVTIPAGAKVDLQGNRFAGPLYIGAQLGTSAIVK